MRICGLVIVSLLAMSCSSWREGSDSFPLSHLGPRANTHDECVALGGTWDRLSTESFNSQCAVPTTDGGTICTDHSQCQGLCVAEIDVEAGTRISGQCRSSYNTTGRCDIRVANGRAESKVCID